ncbi:MAG: hypothetical protein F4Y62_12610 [Rhodospirillaceae bacterium]|nr:hypothetical protein [Rhodospirillaceae bacterium]MYK14503.1 hypothetical protein [Rhodospirillaceae bacterium]
MKLGVVAVLTASVLAAGCITAPKDTAGTAGGSTPPAEPAPTPAAKEQELIEERWSCDNGEIVLEAICAPRGKFCVGTVKVGSFPTKVAQFGVSGVERRWDWELKDGAWEYALVITTRGWAYYYDFRGSRGKRIKPNGVFRCTSTG